jgi:hypothetical protein
MEAKTASTSQDLVRYEPKASVVIRGVEAGRVRRTAMALRLFLNLKGTRTIRAVFRTKKSLVRNFFAEVASLERLI